MHVTATVTVLALTTLGGVTKIVLFHPRWARQVLLLNVVNIFENKTANVNITLDAVMNICSSH